MPNLEELFRARLASGDDRLGVAALSIRNGEMRVLFAGIGTTEAVILSVLGNTVSIITPNVQEAEVAEVKPREDAGVQQATYVDAAAMVPQPNPPPAPNDVATAAAAAATGGANGVEGESATGNAPAAKPAWVNKNDHNKAGLLELAERFQAVVEAHWTKAEIAQAINEKTGAVPPAE